VTTAEIALVAAGAALAFTVLAWLSVHRHNRRAHDQVAGALTTICNRMMELSSEVAGALERVRVDGERMRALDELARADSLEDALTRAVDAALAIPGADAALARAEGSHGEPVVAATGVSRGLAERQMITGPPDGRPVRSVRLAYLYGGDDEPPGALRTAIALPLSAEGELVGLLAVFSHDPSFPTAAGSLTQLEEIAATAGRAVASRAVERSTPQDHDTLTGLGTRRTFHETLAREIVRARRYGHPLAVMQLDLDDFKRVNEVVGQLRGDAVLASVARRISEATGDQGVACRIGGDEFGLVLPESSHADAEALLDRIRTEVGQIPGTPAPVTLSGGSAELRNGDDALELLDRAGSALRLRKRLGR
jgi:diguanylate cyclase (GGDEF)-like protein